MIARGSTVRAFVLAVAVVLGAAKVALCAQGLAPAFWPMLGSSTFHTSSTGFLGPGEGDIAWTFPASGAVDGGVAVNIDGSIYFASANGQVYALQQNGRQIWQKSIPAPVQTVPAIDRNGRVFIGDASGAVRAFDTRGGTVQWTYFAGSSITGSPAVGRDGTLYVGTSSSGLHALHPDGSPSWTAAVGHSGISAPAIGGDGTVYVGTSDGVVMAIAPGGSTVWEHPFDVSTHFGAPSIHSPAIHSRLALYVGASDGVLRCLDGQSGDSRWELALGPGALTGAALGRENDLYVGTASGAVLSVRDLGSSARVLWRKSLGAPIVSTPAIDRVGGVYVGTDDGQVYGLRGHNGEVRWSAPVGSGARSAVAITLGGRALIGTRNGQVHAIGKFRRGDACWNDLRMDPDGMNPEEARHYFQVMLAACGGRDVEVCKARARGAVNADRISAALKLVRHELDPARYLLVIRDRSRKLRNLSANGGARLCEALADDVDGDFVADSIDRCPDTPPLTATFDDGCTDTSTPEGPPADLVYRFLDTNGFPFDRDCSPVVPESPVPYDLLFDWSVDGSGKITQYNTVEFQFYGAANQDCGVWYQAEVYVRQDDGRERMFDLVFQSARTERPSGVPPGVLSYTVKSSEPGVYGEFIRSLGSITRYRLRAMNYAGYQTRWGEFR